MSNVWSRFDGMVSADEVVEAKAQFKPIEPGTYTMRLEKLEPAESQKGLPMLKGQFRTEENKVVFYNQMLQNLNYPNMTAVNIAEAVTFVSDLLETDIEFTDLGSFAEIVMGIEMGGSYTIEVSYGKKDTEMAFPKLKCLGVIPF